MSADRPREAREPIAITGIGCRLPGGAHDFSSAWSFFREGRDAVGPVPPDRWDASAHARTPSGRVVPQTGAFLEGVDRFDADLFGISPREARAMDPQQRLLLEVAWAALEDAGVPPDTLTGSPVGVYVGMGLVDWERRTFADERRLDAWSGTGTFDSVAAGRISYSLGLSGPAMAVHTACSSSLVAMHLAAQALRQGECDRALAGGVNLLLSPEPTVYFAELAALSPTGRCRTFDAGADGYVRGEGVALLVMRRLSDALRDGDHVYGVLLGSALNQDGRTTALTAPSGAAQQAVIRQAIAEACLEPADIGYVEAHGTGTPLGDPVEVNALARVFGSGERPLYVGSAKTQLGHLEAAAGVVGVLRALGAVRSGFVPPHLHLETLNPRISLQGTRLEIPTRGLAWDSPSRIASVSSFGMSGTNAHVVLGLPPEPKTRRKTLPRAPAKPAAGPALVAVSGPTPAQAMARWRQVQQAPELGLDELARAASAGRSVHRHRIAVVAREGEPLPDAPEITSAGRPPGLVFAYTGQGSQYPGMGTGLYAREPAYREAMDEVASLYRARTGHDLLAVIAEREGGRLDDTRFTQPALFAVQWALTRLLERWGVRPDAVLGHSIGEMVAAVVAGVATLEQGVAMVAARAELLAEQPPGGAMLAVHAPQERISELLSDQVELAAVNAPDEVVLAGTTSGIEAAAAELGRQGVRSTRLQVSHAFHSRQVAAAGPALAARIGELTLSAPRVPLYTAVDGGLAARELATGAFWDRHLRQPVRFADAVRASVEDGLDLFLEIGPRRVLSSLGARIAPQTTWLLGLSPDRDERERVLETLAALFRLGVRLDLRGGMGWWGKSPRPAFPPYPFAGERHWLPPLEARAELSAEAPRVPRYRLVAESRPYLAKTAGQPGDELLPLAEARELPEVARRLRQGSGRLWVVVREEGVTAEAARGFGATAALELPQRWGGVLVGREEDAARALGAMGPEDDAAVGPEGMTVPRLVPVHGALPEPPALDPQRWVVLTGGTGALGLALARWLVDLGARRLLLLSRRGGGDPAVLQELRGRGAEVRVEAVDITDETAVQGVLAGLEVQGAVHAAGVSEPRPVLELDEASFLGPYLPKVRGAELLSELPGFLLLVSSIAGLWGSPGLAAYGAGNRALRAVARQRRAQGRHASVVALGPLALPGMVSPQEQARFAASGVAPLRVDDVLPILGACLRPEVSEDWVAAEVDWQRAGPLLSARRPRPLLERLAPMAPPPLPAPSSLLEGLAALPEAARPGAVMEGVAPLVARVLGRDPSLPLPPEVGLFELGLDSAMAVELAQSLRAYSGLPLPATVAFDHPTLQALVQVILGALALPAAPPVAPSGPPAGADEPIAIVGMACRFPGAPDPESYWRLLEQGLDAVGPAPAGRFVDVPEPLRQAGWLEDIASYEPEFFGISPPEAPAVDPQQRLVLEVGWEALERAGLAPDRLADSAVAVFVGAPRSEYWDSLHDPDAVIEHYPWVGTGNESSFVAGRLAHLLGTRGPAVTLNTACSSSLVAVHLACRALRDGEAELALAGGVNVLLSGESSRYLAQIGALSPSGRCRTFDAGADGYVRGEGCGFVVLKRLSSALRDGDRVLALIRGSATGHDGRSSGLGVPSGPAQQEVIARALRAASVEPSQISVLEAHGTGTPLGDPIELGAVSAALGRGRERPLLVTASKSNVGHLETAAGMAGLIKLVLALQHGQVPGTAHLSTPNPDLPRDFPHLLPSRTVPWEGPRLASISSFGISGTLAHVVVEGYAQDVVSPGARGTGEELLLLSAHSEAALAALADGVARALPEHAPVALSSTLAHGRAARRHRLAVAGGPAELSAELARATPSLVERPARVGWLFTGQGSQHVALLRAVVQVDARMQRIVQELLAQAPDPEGLQRVVLQEDEAVHETRWTQPALVLLQLALAEWLSAHGLVPVVVLGHSVGELAAAAVAGILSPRDALQLATVRGQAMGSQPPGAMAALRAGEELVRARLIPGLELAAVNAPDEVVVAGPRAQLEPWLASFGPDARLLRTSHAFHSAAMEGALLPVSETAARLEHHPAKVPFVSGLDGALRAQLEPGYWAEALRAPVRFAQALQTAGQRCDLFVELGPRPVLSALAARVLPAHPSLGTLSPDQPARTGLLRALGEAWARGARLEPGALVPRLPPVRLPTTPWQRTRHLLSARESLAVPRLGIVWREAPRPQAPLEVSVAGDPELAARLAQQLPEGGPGSRLLWAVRMGSGTGPAADALSFVQAALGGARPLTLLTRGAQSVAGEPADPAQAAVWGLAATLVLEHPELEVRLVDLPADGALEGLAAALGAGEPRVALRAGRALVPRLAEAPSRALPVQDRVVVVTGGTGAVGGAVVDALLERGARHVVVAARRPGPERERVSFVQADVSQPEDVQRLLETAGRHGPLGVVLHAAGLVSSGLLRDVSPSELERLWAAKVEGARHLDARVPPEVPLVAFSSAIGWLGRTGAAAYGAANAALDAVIAARRARGGEGLSLLWGPWDAGMARAQDWSSEGVRPLSVPQGQAALLAGGEGLVMPIQTDGPAFARRFGAAPPPWLEGLPGLPARSRAEPELVVALRALPERERTSRLRGVVTEVVSQVIGAASIPAERGLFDLGLDSLGAVEVARRLGQRLGMSLSPTAVFDHPDVARLARHLEQRLAPYVEPAAPTVSVSSDEPIAIVSMACRFPGANSPEELWRLLLAGEVPIREVPPSRWPLEGWFDPEPGRAGKMYVREGGFIDGIDQFDPEFFGISPREAVSLDPQQRLLLEVCWEALERGGLTTSALKGSRTGVYVGIAERHYLLRSQKPGALYPDAWAGTGTEPSFAPGRVAFALGLQGPVVALNTTCSSSLVAVHLAARALRDGECDLALAGGVSLMLLPDDTAYLCAMGALSPTHRCHTFEASADGYVRSEGAGMVALQRLSDARRQGNPVLAVLRSSALGHDGASSGLTVPNGAAQEQVLREALARSGAAPSEVGYLEAHGTGTRLGDPIEVRAAMAVYGERGSAGPLVLGAVKANLGHLELAAGMASLLKAVLVLQHRLIPPQPGFVAPNPELDLRGAVVPQHALPWPDGTRLAAISGFGLSGTNAHLILEGSPEEARVALLSGPERPVHLLALSAGSEGALRELGETLAEALPAPLADVAHTLNRRRPLAVRAAVVAADEAEARQKLRALTPRRPGSPRVAFLFSGQGSQHGGMGLALARACPVVEQALLEYAQVLDPLLGLPLLELLADDERLRQTEYTQPALMALELALARALRSWGVVPDVVAGHSLGELAAATVAGVWSEADALRLAVARGQGMTERALPGAMMALGASAAEVERWLAPGAEIAALNAPDETVVAGSEAAVEATARRVPEGTAVHRLKVSRPFHSACVEPVLEGWERAVAATEARSPSLPLVSLLTGRLEDAALRTPAFWRRHARERVRFTDGLEALVQQGCDVLVEVGPHPVLLGLARRSPLSGQVRLVATQRREADSWRTLCEALGALFEAGVDPDWQAWDAPYARQRVIVPTTPFDRRRFWLEEPEPDLAPAYGVQWRPDPTEQSLPRSVRLQGSVPGLAEALAARGVAVEAQGEWVLDARPLAGGRLEDLLLALDDGDDRPRVVLTRDAERDPVQSAVWGFVRCWALERPQTPLHLLDVGSADAGAILDGLRSGEPEVRLGPGREVPRLVPLEGSAQAPRLSGRWWVTGGLGALGSALSRWLVRQGAQALVLTTRSALGEGDPRALVVQELERAGAQVHVAVVDASDEVAMTELLGQHPPDGVVHCAGITEPQAVKDLDPAVVGRTLAGKVGGALVLDRLLSGRALQGFVLISSIAAAWGSRDLAVYAAANALLDGLARARRARGEPATALALGPVAGGGMVDAAREAELARAGLVTLSPDAIARRLGEALAAGRPHTVVVRADFGRLVQGLEIAGPRPLFDQLRPARAPAGAVPSPSAAAAPAGPRLVDLPPAEREAALLAQLERRVREVMRLDPGRPLPVEQALSDLGFDSLMATELKSVLLADGLDVPLGRLLGGPSLEELALMAAARMPQPAETPPPGLVPLPAGGGPDLTLLWTHLSALIVGVGLASAVWALL
jgi:acyl transferase domain-containing protein/NAD(P)-dependent dehydrogenase (short-subunit alcohol dehydrogenase family)/acyl carrier protein